MHFASDNSDVCVDGESKAEITARFRRKKIKLEDRECPDILVFVDDYQIKTLLKIIQV